MALSSGERNRERKRSSGREKELRGRELVATCQPMADSKREVKGEM